MRRWKNSIRVWSGPMFPLVIMQLVLTGAMVLSNALGLMSGDVDPFRVWMLAGWTPLFILWVVILVGAMRQRAADRRSPHGEVRS